MKKRFMLCVVTLAVLVSCFKENTGPIENLNGGRIDVFGHAGMGAQNIFQPLPINSWASFTHALDNTDTDGVELDVQITLDSVLVAYHDQDLSSTTGCNGCIPQFNFQEIAACEYLAPFPEPELTLVKVKALVERYANSSFAPLFSLDTKTVFQCFHESDIQAYADQIAYAYWELISQSGLQEQIWVETSAHQIILAVRALDPTIRIYWVSNEMPLGIQQAIDLGCDGLVVSNDEITKEQVAWLHENGLFVSLFGIKDRSSHIRAINKSPDHIQTDNIEMALDLLN